MRTTRPWVATGRSVIITALAIVPALPEIAKAAGIDTVPFVASILAVSAAITRVIAVPAVHAQLDRLLHRTPTPPAHSSELDLPGGRHRKDDS